ncbi:MAG: hypothetical protein KDC01_08460 [Flavobacteriales bacterium]|nr:hypothetical protein [Flavobacteriales bacterium]
MNLITTISLLVSLIAAQGSLAQDNSGSSGEPSASDPGFTEALFDAATVSDLLKSEEAMGIRFYNVLAEPRDADGTAMAIGIRTNGSELNAGKSYRLSLGFVDGKIAMSNLNTKSAGTACVNMDDPTHPSYSASFTRTDVQALLDLTGCQALQAVPDTTVKDETTMRLVAMKVTDGKAFPLGSGPEFQRMCGFPCPLVCGPEENYVYRSKY